jgi:hypothetical protein
MEYKDAIAGKDILFFSILLLSQVLFFVRLTTTLR